ncbi:MAG TPA: peptidoglycan-associated lipoprotein Pal [Thiobacillaceae bacterium]|nr:peptidoglycan-associated lipoprotein Pal [Thiobacillaceae bacterium]HNU64392.1 peptidoglycan-associated lipoprotein Pal [Thiobacillaceae bacterium]
MKQAIPALILLALLAGCAEQPPKDAVIEDRAIRSSPPAVTGYPVDARPATGRPMDTPAMAAARTDGTTAPAADAARPQAGAQLIETRPLAGADAQVKPLDGTPLDGERKDEASTADVQNVIALKLKDPNSPLSKRIIHFDFDSSVIRDEFRGLLEAHAEFLKSNPDSKVILQGHTDERGSREYNLALGQRRAESVYSALSLLGVGDAQMEAVSLGEEKPLVEGHDESAWQQNRRAEILYQGE